VRFNRRREQETHPGRQYDDESEQASD
jgi:hypothetical protein